MKKITSLALTAFLLIVSLIYLTNLFSGNTTPPANRSATASLSSSDVAKHSTADDCYLIINNNVYNVSSYMNSHPGGSWVIASRCGNEVTGIFAQIHSNRAWDLLAKYKLGTIAPTSTATNSTSTVPIDLNSVEAGLKKSNPDAQILNVKPSSNFYIAKIIYQGKLYEVHIDANGQIFKEEVENDEFNWSTWNTDTDDLQPK